MKASTQLLLALCIASGATAQKVNYEMIEDDPKFNGLTIAPFTGVNYSFGQTFAMNIGMEVWVRKLPVHLHGYIDQTYLSAAAFTADITGPRIIEMNAALPFGSKSQQKMSRTVLKSSSTKTTYTETIHTTSVATPATILSMNTLRAGIYRNKGSYRQDVTFEGDASTTLVTTDYRNTGLLAGISRTWQRNTVIDAEGWGKRRNMSFLELYFDTMVGMFQDFGAESSAIVTREPREVPGSGIDSRRIGWRTGMYLQLNNYDGRRPNSYGARMEFGKRPGPSSEKWWLNVQAIYFLNW